MAVPHHTASGMRAPSDHAYQDIANTCWPQRDADGFHARDIRVGMGRIAVTARIVWEHDGEELVEAVATRWNQRAVYVEFGDARMQLTGVWIAPGDVVRR